MPRSRSAKNRSSTSPVMNSFRRHLFERHCRARIHCSPAGLHGQLVGYQSAPVSSVRCVAAICKNDIGPMCIRSRIDGTRLGRRNVCMYAHAAEIETETRFHERASRAFKRLSAWRKIWRRGGVVGIVRNRIRVLLPNLTTQFFYRRLVRRCP